MWLIDYITKNSISSPKSETGEIKDVSDGKVQVKGSSDFRQLPIIAPYGVAYVPATGSQTAVMPVNSGEVCLGTVCDFKSDLKPGEVMLYSAGGATIALKNDGYVYINGVKFKS